MPMQPHPTSFGVFKPVGHVVMSFASESEANAAAQALQAAGFNAGDIYRYTAQEMQSQAEGDIENASDLAAMGQELNLVKAHRALALQGQSFVVVKTESDVDRQRVTEIAVRHQATRAQHFGIFVTEELVPPGDTAAQTSETPDRGLDLQEDNRHDVLSRDGDA